MTSVSRASIGAQRLPEHAPLVDGGIIVAICGIGMRQASAEGLPRAGLMGGQLIDVAGGGREDNKQGEAHLDVPPKEPVKNPLGGGARYPIHLSEASAPEPFGGTSAPHISNDLVGELGGMVGLSLLCPPGPFVMSPLRDHVPDVVTDRPKEEVAWADAQAVVAVVADAEAIWDGPVHQLPDYSICPFVLLCDLDLPIPGRPGGAPPEPTAGSLFDAAPDVLGRMGEPLGTGLLPRAIDASCHFGNSTGET